MADSKLYADRDHMELGDYYTRHVSAMTAEGLHAKSDIAAELAWRDREIDRLRALSPAGGGWVMVPRMLTQEMREVLTVMLTKCHTVDESYSDLIAAAPQPQPDRMTSMIEHGMSAIDWTPVRAAASPQQEPGACPHIVQSKEGTAYCRLAESAGASGGEWELIGYEYQHDETGRTTFVELQQYEWGWEKNNERWTQVGPCYRPRNLAAAPQPQDRPYDWPECSGDPMDCPENEGFGCCKPVGDITTTPPAHGDGEGVKSADVERALSIFYGKPWPNGYVRDVQEKARSNMYRVLRHLTATSAGTTGDDSEDALAYREAIEDAIRIGADFNTGADAADWLRDELASIDAARRAREVGK